MPKPLRVSMTLVPLVLAVLLAHALLLGLLPLGVGDGWRGGVKPALQVRQIEQRPALAPAPVPESAPVQVAEPTPLPAPAIAAAVAASQPEPMVVAVAAAVAPAEAAASLAVAAVPPAAAPAPAPAPAASDAGGGQPLPVYATRMPAPVLLRYDLKRGVLAGTGELAWRPAHGRYLLTLEGSAFSINVLNWRSEGGFDSAGIAPERFVDRRRGRDARAANFQRDSGRITFSGPPVDYPLTPGAQDRLSWMLQLSAIIEADPARYRPGAQISLFVVGARGDADVWTFSVEASEALDLPSGRVAATLRLKREPRKPYDTLGEIWLDPARAHLPVRVRLSVPQADESTEFLLREMQPL